MKGISTIAFLVFMAVHVTAQPVEQRSKSFSPTVCYLTTANAHTLVDAPATYKNRGAGRTQSSNIEVTYQGFSPEAQAAFQAAVEIWETLLTSDVTIHILARWAPLGTNVLGSAGPGTYFVNFDGAPKTQVWYPVALAEKLARKDLNDPTDPDIVATFNSANASWHYGTTTQTPAGKYDLMSIVLHEIGHGLGITHAYTVSGGQGLISTGFSNAPGVYETNIENTLGENLVNEYQQPSTTLGTQLTSESLFYDGAFVLGANLNQRARIYAPSVYSAGSSIAHLDEDTYPAGNSNSLMTPFISAAERILDPGPISMAILKEIGWSNTFISHTKLPASENTTSPYVVKCTVTSETAFDANSVKMSYSANGSTFTEVAMSPTGNANEFSASIPTGSSSYKYFISLTDADQRKLTKPGIFIKHGEAPGQSTFQFNVGPDTKAPIIFHTAKTLMLNTEPLALEAVVSEALGIQEVKLEYRINGVSKPTETFTLKSDSTYTKEITFAAGTLNPGDKIEYRIRAKDSSVAGNEAFTPSSSTFFTIDVEGFGTTLESYQNTFNSTTNDFFGDGFSITTPSGFSNAALHTTHPYPEGNGAPNDRRELIQYLKVPVRVLAANATISFDEIVLVEPGETGSVFGDDNFFDYVVVEGSKDGGKNWTPLANGYDSRDYTPWLTRFNSATSGNNSTAVGDPTLFRNRNISLLNKFSAGDELVFRFRLFSDPFSSGWGWAIDNLKIQKDVTPPTVQHQHHDYVMTNASKLELKAKATDGSSVQKVFVEYSVNGGTSTPTDLALTPTADTYSLDLPLTSLSLKAGDLLTYKIKAQDTEGNEAVFPSSGSIQVVALSLQSPASSLVTDFSNATEPVHGNYFGVTKITSSFPNLAMHSEHPYAVANTPDGNVNFSWIVKTPITVDGTNPFIVFDEVALTEYSGASVKDYVIVEATKDGVTWEKLVDPYGSLLFANWKSTFDANGTPTATLYHERRIDVRQTGKFKNGDVILLRFRLLSDAATTGWGWVVDNLSIQGPITGINETRSEVFNASPNPATDRVRVTASVDGPQPEVTFRSALGQVMHSEGLSPELGRVEKEFDVTEWPAGLYLVTVTAGTASQTRKVLIVK